MNKLIREDYLSEIRKHYSSDKIKILSGIKNSGKTTLLHQIMYEISSFTEKSRIIYIDFEKDFSEKFDLRKELSDKIKANGLTYIFLDEFYLYKNICEAVESLRQNFNCSFFLCTSKDCILDFNNEDVIRFIIRPLSYRESLELLKLNGVKISDDFITNYISWGGLPQRFEIPEEKVLPDFFEKNIYLLTKELIFKRNSPQEQYKFNTIVNLLLGNCGKEFKASFIKDFCNFNKTSDRRISEKKTVYNYLEKAEKIYLVSRVKRFDISSGKVLVSKEKHYATDIAYKTLKSKFLNSGITCTLKNIVFNELAFRGYEIYNGKTYKGEIDFVVFGESKKCYIQVLPKLTDAKTIARVFSSFSPIKDASPRYVITMDRLDFSHDGITHINIEDFLLNRKALILF